MFWTGQCVSVLIMLLGLSILRIQVRRLVPKLEDWQVDTGIVVLFFASVWLAVVATRQELAVEDSLRTANQEIAEIEGRERL